MNRQRKILLLLVAGFCLALGYAWFGMPEQKRVASMAAPATRVAESARRPEAATTGHQLRVDLLEPAPQRYRSPKRDLFNFYVPPVVAPPKPPPVVAPPKPAPPPVPTVDPEEVRRAEVRHALARFTFLGFLLKDQKRTVFLSQGENLFLVQEGERFGDSGRFHAVSITPEMMSIRQSDAAGSIEIPLIEKEPLIPTFEPRPSAPVRTPALSAPATNPSVRPAPTVPRAGRGGRWPLPAAPLDVPAELPPDAASFDNAPADAEE